MNVRGTHVSWWLILFVVISAIGAIASIVFMLTINSDLKTDSIYFQTPFTYEYNLLDVEETNLCPGDMLMFEYQVHVPSDGAFVARITETITTGNGVHVVFDEHPFYANQIGPIDIIRTLSVQIPDLPPGDYQYRRAGALPPSSGSPAFMAIPFRIMEGCK